MKIFTLIDPVDMSVPMYGNGCATVVAAAIRVMGNRLILVGVTSDEKLNPVGRWSNTKLFGRTCEFFPVITSKKLEGKYFKNLSFTISLIWHWKAILTKASRNVITQYYTVMWWLTYSKHFTCRVFYFPGLGNQLLIGRKKVLGKLLYRLYDVIHLNRLLKIEYIFAAASVGEIEKYCRKWHAYLNNKPIYQLPTSVDIDYFSPQKNIIELKEKYHLRKDAVHFVCVGRLAKVKGVDFIIDAFEHYSIQDQNACLLIVGDGEEREQLQNYVRKKGLVNKIVFMGVIPPNQVRDIVCCSNVCLIGSSFEGFSCSMLEQVSCGIPLVSTNVSGACDLILNGENGYVVLNREPKEFAGYMLKALNLPDAMRKSRELIAGKYSEHSVWQQFLSIVENGSKNKVD